MSHGPLMLDLAGVELSPEERERLMHPASGGVILFSRNYESPAQTEALVSEIHGLRTPSLLVAVDQEGGRVQRFRDGLTRLPPAAWFGQLYGENPKRALNVARSIGWLMATELRSLGIDFSFAPVLDLGGRGSTVIGDRAFHRQPVVVGELAHAWMSGVHSAGMAAVGKHFPGHGSVREDSHSSLPVDRRRLEDVMMDDLQPFQRLIGEGIEAIMPAHVVYEKASGQLAGFSDFWLKQILREKLGFQGVVFSDDLTMAAAEEAGGYPARARCALESGCDMILVCNNPEGAVQVIEELSDYTDPTAQMRMIRMHGKGTVNREQMRLDPRWREAIDILVDYEDNPVLDMNFD
ncbi:MAG: beta-N-acetylhexosaminidase [Gammaproteobacteria bacterium]|nr:beta-N-acetylhexosaminidase [Gammaproteobacteria bacterium]